MFRCHWTRAAVAIGLLALAAPSAAEIYRWVDGSGREHFAMDLNQVPAAYRDQAAARAKASGQRINVVTPSDGSKAPATRQPPAARGRPAAAEKPGGYGEAWWRRQHAKHVRFVESAQEFLDWQNEVVGRSHSRDEREIITKAEAMLQAAEKRQRDFQERARMSGVPPGWVR